MKGFISGETKILGVIGNPVKHSLSPVFQNYLIKSYKLNWAYLPFCVDVNKFDFFINGMKVTENIIGFNLTVPFKETVLSHCDVLSEEVKKINAVNTIFFKDNKLYGYNTDVFGIHKTLETRLNISSLKGKTVILIGAGGAAKAAIYAVDRMSAENIFIVNRSLDRAELLKLHVEKNFNFKNVYVRSLDKLNTTIHNEQPYLIINSTTIGLKDEMLPINFEKLWNKTKIFDMVYNVQGTPLVKEALKRGVKAVDGFYMLIYQGIKSFSIWSKEKEIDAASVIGYLKRKISYGKTSCNR